MAWCLTEYPNLVRSCLCRPTKLPVLGMYVYYVCTVFGGGILGGVWFEETIMDGQVPVRPEYLR